MKEYFDIPLMEQRMAHGAFELDTTIDTVLGFMLQMCAPARDEAIQTVYLLQDSVDRIQSIMEILQDMVFDLMNFRLSTLRPVLMPIAVEYEKQKFAEALSHGQVGLAKTRGWLQSTYHRVKEATAQRHPEAAPSVPAMTVVFEEAFSSLVTSKTPIMRPTCPETLLLDLDRMAMYQREAHAIITTAALVMLARNFGTQCPLETLAKTLLVMLEDTSISIEHLTAQIKRDIPDTTQHAMIQSMVEKTVSQEDMVYTLLTRRVGTIVRYQLSTGQWVQKEVVVSSGLDYVHQPLKGLCHKLNILASHHRQVYASWYESILHDEQTYPSSS
ncbi:T-complex 11 [Spinellus fusiger]|nr:T-complex 11 [Spinellus fusiger]